MIKQLWRSTRELHKRFNVYPPKANDVRKVFLEETRELVDASREIDAILKLPDELRQVDDLVIPRQHFAEELADVIVTMLALADAYGVSRPELRRGAQTVACKNDGKIPGITHEVNRAGKIARIKKDEVQA